ncbi:MAG: helix-turn-helix transcriptional regulator [Luteimonas sp.]
MRDYLARCSGRTAQRKQHTLLRLLRVRHLIASNPSSRFDLLHLSRIADYSPWHLTRTYREVFGETPAEQAARIRLARAVELVHTGVLSVREITEALGFESESTFCRYFKKAHGLTTTQARVAALHDAKRSIAIR